MSQESIQTRLWTVPNLLSFGRVGLAIGTFALIAYEYYLAAVVVFLIAALTDALDGYLARLLNQESALGRQLDPLVDKIVVTGSFVYILALQQETGLAPWMVTVIIARELVVQALRSLIEGQGHAFGARMAGKLKTTFQFASIVGILTVLGFELKGTWLVVRDALTWVAVLLTIYSGLTYVTAAWSILRRGPSHSTTA